MLGKPVSRKFKATFSLAALLASSAMMTAPGAALAQFADMLSDPGQGTQTLRNPLIPGAPNAAAGQPAWQGQPPPVGNGPFAPPHIRGDLGAPSLPPSGVADPTSGNIFPARPGSGPMMPWEYIPGIGRHQTQSGQEQGVINNGGNIPGSQDWGPGGQMMGTAWQNNGGAPFGATGMGPGGKNGGSDWINNGGSAPGSTEWGPGGQMMGTTWMNNGGAPLGATGMGPGGKNGGSDWINNGGAAPGATGYGPGGQMMGTTWMNNGGAANGATGMGPGGKNGGTGWVNNGGAANGAQGYDAGGKNGGSTIMNNGGAGAGATPMGPGGKNGGTDVVNNGGAAPNAVAGGDTNRTHAIQPSMYDYQGPLPTVRVFARYLVILGVVVATVFMAMAGWGMVCGASYAGSRAIGAAAGLLLLLGGYTIWKVVQMNTFHGNSTGWWSQYQNGQRITGGGQAGQPFTAAQNPGNGNGNNGGGNNGGGANNGGGNNGTIGGMLGGNNGGGNPGGNNGGGNNGTIGGMLGGNNGGGNNGGGNTGGGGIPAGGNNGGGGTIGSMFNNMGGNNGPIPNPPSN